MRRTHITPYDRFLVLIYTVHVIIYIWHLVLWQKPLAHLTGTALARVFAVLLRRRSAAPLSIASDPCFSAYMSEAVKNCVWPCHVWCSV